MDNVDRDALKKRLNELVADSLVYCKKYKFDVYNALSLMDNALFLEDQKFGGGDGQLHYYLFNYRANPIAGGVDKRNRLDTQGLSGIGYVKARPSAFSSALQLTACSQENPDLNTRHYVDLASLLKYMICNPMTNPSHLTRQSTLRGHCERPGKCFS